MVFETFKPVCEGTFVDKTGHSTKLWTESANTVFLIGFQDPQTFASGVSVKHSISRVEGSSSQLRGTREAAFLLENLEIHLLKAS